MWSKGVVVIIKHGDQEMSNEMAKGLTSATMTVNNEEMDRLKRDNFFLKRRSKRTTNRMIRKARRKYGQNRQRSENLKWLSEGLAFVQYCFATFVEKVIGK